MVSDEVYEHLVFEGEHIPIATLPGMRERTVTISSAAKTFSFTGWKIGWATGTPELVTAVRTVKQFLTYVTGGPFQYAVAQALALPDSYFTSISTDLRAKRDLLCAGLADVGFEVFRPAGTYFVTTDVRSLGEPDGMEFCRELPARAGVVAIPSSVFYDNVEAGRTQVRFAYCKKEEVLREALARLARRGLGVAVPVPGSPVPGNPVPGSPVSGRPASGSPVSGDEAFGADLYGRLPGQGNLVFSPASIATALRLVLLGARGETAAQIAAALHLAIPDGAAPALQAAQELQAVSAILSDLAAGDLTLRAPNAMWVQSGLPLEPGFTAAVPPPRPSRCATPTSAGPRSRPGRRSTSSSRSRPPARSAACSARASSAPPRAWSWPARCT